VQEAIETMCEIEMQTKVSFDHAKVEPKGHDSKPVSYEMKANTKQKNEKKTYCCERSFSKEEQNGIKFKQENVIPQSLDCKRMKVLERTNKQKTERFVA
jgi:hypothetical protein